MCAKFYELVKSTGSKKFLTEAYKEFLDSMTSKLDDEVSLVSGCCSSIMQLTEEADTLSDAINMLSDDIDSILMNDNGDVISELGNTVNGLIAYGEVGYVKPFVYAKLQSLFSLLDDYNVDVLDRTLTDQLATKMGLYNDYIYPLTNVEGTGRLITFNDIENGFSPSEPFSLMTKLKEAIVTNSAVTSVFDMYEGDDVEARQKFDVASFQNRMASKMGALPDSPLMTPAINILNMGIKSPNASTFLSVFNKLLSYDEDEGYGDDFTPSNNDFSQYTGSSWAGFWGMASNAVTAAANGIATVGKCSFSVIGGAFMGLTNLAFKVTAKMVNAITKFIYEIFDPVAIGIASGNSATVEGFGVISNNHRTPLYPGSATNDRNQLPLYRRYFPNSSVRIKTSDRVDGMIGKWVYIEMVGLKGLYKINSVEKVMIDGVEHYGSMNISCMVKPCALDFPAASKFNNLIQTHHSYNIFRLNTVTASELDDLATDISNSMIQKLEDQTGGNNLERIAAICLLYPYIMINSIAWDYVTSDKVFDAESAENFNDDICWSSSSVSPGWSLGASKMGIMWALEALRNINGSSKNLSNADFVAFATGQLGDRCFDRPTLANESLSSAFIFAYMKLCPWPFCPFLAILKDFGDEPAETFIPFTTTNIGDWGTEQITIKTDSDLATSALLKVAAVAAAVTAIFVGPKIAGKVIQRNTDKLKQGADLIANTKQKIAKGERLSFIDKLKYRRAIKRENKLAGVLSPTPSVGSISMIDTKQQDDIEDAVENVSNRLF